MSEFWEKYKHPKWQEKRLRIMERACFACAECGDTEVTLNVHHTYYEKGKDPWEYPDASLRCLCQPCHEALHEIQADIKQMLGVLLTTDMDVVRGYIAGLTLDNTSTGAVDVPNAEYAKGVADAFGLEDADVIFICTSVDKGDGTASFRNLHNARRLLQKRNGKQVGLAQLMEEKPWEVNSSEPCDLASTG